MARALIVGCGCRGRALGRRLLGAGWQVRGTSRDPGNTGEILGAGIEAVVADPNHVGTVLDHVGDVTLVFWILGSARGPEEIVAGLHGPRLERLLEEVVDTPVRGIVYEAAGTVGRSHLEQGEGIVRDASDRWRIPVEIVDAEPGEAEDWVNAMLAAAERLTGSRR